MTSPHRAVPFALLISVLAALTAFAPVATDMYLPGMSEMAGYFGTSAGRIQSTISVFFLGLAAGQLIYGPLSDRFGRRMPLMAGIAVYVLASVACAWATSVEVFIALRFAQALGGSAGMLIVRAIVNDLFERTETARILSLMMMVMMLAPILAPLLGGWMIVALGWQSIFWFMALYGALCVVLVVFVVPESLPAHKRQPLGFVRTLKAYAQLAMWRAFVVPALSGGLAMGALFAYITGSEYVFTQFYGLSITQYSGLFAFNALALVAGNIINRRVLLRWRVEQVLTTALVAQAAMASLLLVVALLAAPVAVFIAVLWLAVGVVGLVGANSAAIAMGATGPAGGSGSGVLGLLQYGLAFTVSGGVAAAQNGTVFPMVVAIWLCAACACALWCLGRIRSLPAQGGGARA